MAKLSQLFDLIKTETVEDTDVIAAVRDIEGSAEDVAFTVGGLRGLITSIGSNENGSWAKIYMTEHTGLMVCWTLLSHNINGNSNHTGDWIFPQEFAPGSDPAVVATAGQSGFYDAGIQLNLSDSSRRHDQCTYRMFNTSGASRTTRAWITAIGMFDDEE